MVIEGEVVLISLIYRMKAESLLLEAKKPFVQQIESFVFLSGIY